MWRGIEPGEPREGRRGPKLVKTLGSHRRFLEGRSKNWWPCGSVWWEDRKAGSDVQCVPVVSFPIPAPRVSEHKAWEIVMG